MQISAKDAIDLRLSVVKNVKVKSHGLHFKASNTQSFGGFVDEIDTQIDAWLAMFLYNDCRNDTKSFKIRIKYTDFVSFKLLHYAVDISTF